MERLHPATSGLLRAPSERLPVDVVVQPLVAHRDTRGLLAEFYRGDWRHAAPPVHWAMTISTAGVMRGVHVHLQHHDYVVVLQGRATAGLRDLRPGSPTEGLTTELALCGEQPTTIIIPPGVAHGFYFHDSTAYVLGITRPYDPGDDLGCHWRDPDLGIAWPARTAQLSVRDAELPPLHDLAPRIPPWRPA